MSDFLPEDVREGLRIARARKRCRQRLRLTIHAGDDVYPILRMFDAGFEVDSEKAPHLRGLVDIYDGPRHLARALIVASTEDDGVMRYEYKRNTFAADSAPKDFVRPDGMPELLLPSS